MQYPANWLRLASPVERVAIGISEVTEQPRPDERYYWVTDNGDGTYSVSPKDIDVLKALRVSEVKAQAGSILSNTDWRVIRAAETGAALDASVAAERQAVRDHSNSLEAQIQACSTVEELAALQTTWPE